MLEVLVWAGDLYGAWVPAFKNMNARGLSVNGRFLWSLVWGSKPLSIWNGIKINLHYQLCGTYDGHGRKSLAMSMGMLSERFDPQERPMNVGSALAWVWGWINWRKQAWHQLSLLPNSGYIVTSYFPCCSDFPTTQAYVLTHSLE